MSEIKYALSLHKVLCLIACSVITLPVLCQEHILLPFSSSGKIIHHTHYSLSYSEDHEQAEWVAYEITKQEAAGNYKRTDDFRPDPLIETGSAALEDYKGSGYDRGHLAPADDMKFSSEAISESFFLSNMSPQDGSFNSGIWRVLEGQVNKWALYYDTLYIVTGGIFTDSMRRIGDNDVTVPEYYYKVVLDLKRKEALAFILPNEKGAGKVYEYVVSVDSVEKVTGIDFFPAFDDSAEDSIESTSDINSWYWRRSQSPEGRTALEEVYSGTLTSREKPEEAGSVRCHGLTQSGKQCKRMTKRESGKCWQHE